MTNNVIGIIATVDFAFKLMLGSPEHTRITIHFLNAVLGGSPRITRVTILNPILGKDFEADKFSVLDILAEDEHGRKFNIEMQTSLLAELPQRLTYYLSSVYSTQLTKGVNYSGLKQAISICVLTNSMFPQDSRLHLDFRLRDSAGLIFTNDLQIHLLELPKLLLNEENVWSAPPIERWAYFLLHADQLTLEDVKRIFPDQEFGEAAGVLEMISKSPNEHIVYDMRLKFLRDEDARRRDLEAARRDLEAALRELETARAEGRNEGRDEGLREGAQKGALLGRIALLQELLGVTKPTTAELSSFDESRLTELAEQLQTQLRDRGSSV